MTDEIATTDESPLKGTWVDSCIYEVAIGILEDSDIMVRYSLTDTEFNELAATDYFRDGVAKLRKSLLADDITIREKAKYAVDILIPTLIRMVESEAGSMTARLDAFDRLTKLTGEVGGADSAPLGPVFQVFLPGHQLEALTKDVGPVVVVEPPSDGS